VWAAAALGATSLLEERLASLDPLVRLSALEALVGAGHRFGGAAAVIEELRDEARRAARALAAARDLAAEAGSPSDEGTRLLTNALRLEADLARERALVWLAGTHDRDGVARARAGLRHPSAEKKALALEVLDVTLAEEEKSLVLPLCQEGERRLESLLTLFPDPARPGGERLLELLQPGAGYRPFTRAAALYVAARRGDRRLRTAVEGALGTADSLLVARTAAFARAALGGDGAPGAPESQEGMEALQKGRGMLTIERVMALKAARMFEEASEDVLAEVAAIVEEVEVPAGEVVFAKGDSGDSMYLVAEGAMRVVDGQRTVGELRAGDVFGELALLDPEPRLFTISAREDSRLLRLDREAFLELMAGNIEIVRGVLHVLCERLRSAEPHVSTERR
jgi:hypothetical protein